MTSSRVLVLLALSMLLRCANPSRQDVPGVYLVNYAGLEDRLELHADGTFEHLVKSAAAVKLDESVSWEREGRKHGDETRIAKKTTPRGRSC